MQELISIIVPVYNVQNELVRCVKSLTNQTYENIEIILVDDGSPDKCPEICEELAKNDKRITVIHQKNGGLSSARNSGLRRSKGKYIMYVDSDDYLEIDACEKLSDGFLNDQIDFVVGAIREIRGNKYSFQRHTSIKPMVPYLSKDFIIASIKANEWFAPAVLNLIRRDFLVKNNLFFREGYLFEDHEMLPRIYLAAGTIVYIDYPFYNYVIRDNSIMTTSDMNPKKVKMSLDIYEGWYHTISLIEDKALKRCLNGILVRYYLRNCRVRKIKGWRIPGFNFKFAITNAMGIKEKAKVLVFEIAPDLYCSIDGGK